MKKLVMMLVAVVVLCGAAQADLINVDFTHAGGSYGVMSGAAATGAAGDVWNGYQPEADFGGYGGGTYTALLDSTGTATAVSLTMGAVSGWGSSYTGNPDFGDPLNSLMRDSAFIFPGWTSTATISGLTPNAAYTLYLYGVSDNAGQNSTFTVDGVSKLAASSDLVGPLTEGEDYVVFTGNTGAGSIDLALDGGGSFCSFNGFQLAVVPEPATMALLGLGAVLLRRKK